MWFVLSSSELSNLAGALLEREKKNPVQLQPNVSGRRICFSRFLPFRFLLLFCFSEEKVCCFILSSLYQEHVVIGTAVIWRSFPLAVIVSLQIFCDERTGAVCFFFFLGSCCNLSQVAKEDNEKN